MLSPDFSCDLNTRWGSFSGENSNELRLSLGGRIFRRGTPLTETTGENLKRASQNETENSFNALK
jgi:hypothetical protein